jgi:subtilisin family serine protease
VASTSQLLASIDWITTNAVKPAVVLFPIGGPINTTLEVAIMSSIVSGLSYVLVAGASNTNACNFSPGRIPEAITVSSTDQTDTRASFANYGPCLDLFAPGVNIPSAWHTSDTATSIISGTSTSAAHVAGVAALLLHAHPTWTPAQVSGVLAAIATPEVVVNAGNGSPNRLLYVD